MFGYKHVIVVIFGCVGLVSGYFLRKILRKQERDLAIIMNEDHYKATPVAVKAMSLFSVCFALAIMLHMMSDYLWGY